MTVSVAIVTGAACGIGTAIADRMAVDMWNVARLDVDFGEISAESFGAPKYEVEVSDFDCVGEVVSRIKTEPAAECPVSMPEPGAVLRTRCRQRVSRP